MGGDMDGRADRVARWLLERCAPGDAEVALSDLDDERRRRGRGAWVLQLLLVCAWGLLGRARAPARGVQPLHAMRMAARGVTRAPGTAATAALILGIGLTATVTLIGTFLGSFRALPVPDGEDVVRVELLDHRARPSPPSPELVEAWRRGSGPLLGVGGTRSSQVTAVLPGRGALRVPAAAVSPQLLDILRVPPVRGRLPRSGPEDGGSVLVRQDVWEELGGTGSRLGVVLQVDGAPLTVVGVMPRDFGFPTQQGLWTVLPDAELAGADQLVGRLRPGVDRGAAAQALAAALFGTAPDAPARVRLVDYVGGRGEAGEALAFGALGLLVAILLVVCTANASTLLLVRARERVDALAVHSAMGASRAQVVLQLLLEAALVAGAGGVLGLTGGDLLLRWTESTLSGHWGYYWMRMEMGPSVVLATAAVVLGCAVVAGTLPALEALRTDLRGVLGGRKARGADDAWGRAGRWFLGGQVTLSTAGLVIALILVDGFVRGSDPLPGVPVDEVAFAVLDLEGATPREVQALAAALRDELGALPGARTASVGVGIPGWGARWAPLQVEGADAGTEGTGPSAAWLAVDPQLRETYDLTLRRGRWLGEGDGTDGEGVAVVTRGFVTRHLPTGDPLGRRIRLEGVGPEGARDGWIRIVGVVDDWIPEGGVTRTDRVLVPVEQTEPSRLLLSVRASGDPAGLVPGLRQAIRRVDPDLVPDRVQTLESFQTYLTRLPRVMGAFGAGGGLAGVLVAAVGLFGILSFRTRSRLPAVGVRMALGAHPERILREVLAEAAGGVLPWIAAGLALGLLLAPATVLFSFGAPFHAPTTYLAAGAVMLLVVLAAALRPAVRAARLEPLTVLRGE